MSRATNQLSEDLKQPVRATSSLTLLKDAPGATNSLSIYNDMPRTTIECVEKLKQSEARNVVLEYLLEGRAKEIVDYLK